MTRSQRIRPIAELAAHYEKQASMTMADTQTRIEQHRDLLQQLEAYHAEYSDCHMPGHADPVRLQDFRLFMDKLEHAIARQRDTIADVQRELERQREHWTHQRRQRKALDNVTERFARAEAQAAEQDEQRQIEEISALIKSRSRL